MLQPNKILLVAVAIAHVPFLFQLHALYTPIMLIFISIDVFRFLKGLDWSKILLLRLPPADKPPYP